MAMKKIKPQFGKVTAPKIYEQEKFAEEREIQNNLRGGETENEKREQEEPAKNFYVETVTNSNSEISTKEEEENQTKSTQKKTNNPNPFLQTKEFFAKARLTKIGYRMRTDYVEILDIIKKIKKNGYTLEAVLDDALTFYFENSEDGREALKKAEIFYS